MLVELNEKEYRVLKKALDEVYGAGYAEEAMSNVTHPEHDTLVKKVINDFTVDDLMSFVDGWIAKNPKYKDRWRYIPDNNYAVLEIRRTDIKPCNILELTLSNRNRRLLYSVDVDHSGYFYPDEIHEEVLKFDDYSSKEELFNKCVELIKTYVKKPPKEKVPSYER